MAEWGDLDARLERKKHIKLRRQQREMKKERMEMETLEKERRKLAVRCEEMAREEQLSIAMMRFYRQLESRERREKQHRQDLVLYGEISAVRKRARQLGLPLTTPEMTAQERLETLQQRVRTREAALETAAQARTRLEALPQKRSQVRKLIQSFFTTSQHRNIENAVYNRRCEAIVQLLEPGIPGKKTDATLLNHESENGLTPVLSTIFERKLAMLRRVLELGASPDLETTWGMTPLLAAVMVDDEVTLSILVEFNVKLECKTQTSVTALHLAAEKGRLKMLKALARHGVDMNKQNVDGRTALMQAAIAGSHSAVKTLLALDADRTVIDKNGQRAIDFAIQAHADHIVSMLKASIPAEDLLASLQDADDQEADASNPIARHIIRQSHKLPGAIAMERALDDGDVDRILELLSVNDLGYGPNYEADSGEMPLLVVARHGSADQVIRCIEDQCLVTQTNRRGENALMKAAYRGDAEVLRVLCDAGVSCFSRDFQGRDIFRYLHDHEHYEQATELRKALKHGAPPRLRLGNVFTDAAKLKRSEPSNGQVGTAVAESPAQIHDDVGVSGADPQSTNGEMSRGSASGDESEERNEWNKRNKWSIRRRVLRHNRKRNEDFEVERERVRKQGERGRRNGLITPLPHDPAGRLKFPPCENCHSSRARKRCFACEQVLCDKCHSRLHELPHRRHHEYEELEPTRMVRTLPVDDVTRNQHESLPGSIAASLQLVQLMKHTMQLPVDVVRSPQDVEVEKFERKQRLQREKEIAQMQINVPVEAAKHAQRLGDGNAYTNPSDIELVDLYITQGKLPKARAVLDDLKRVIEEALGYADPTMLKIHIRTARVDQQAGDLAKSVETLETALGTFESSRRADDKDLVVAQELLLQVLDSLTLYDAAVRHCQRFVRLRTVGLHASHALVRQALARFDEFVAKRERRDILKEDLMSLAHLASSAECVEQGRIEKERALVAFQSMLLEEQPPDQYDSFIAFAKKEFAKEMVHFWVAVERAKTTNEEQDAKAFRAAVVSIFLLYIKSRRIKVITAVQRKRMKKTITTPGKKLPRSIFDEVQSLVFDVIYGRVYRRFCDQAL